MDGGVDQGPGCRRGLGGRRGDDRSFQAQARGQGRVGLAVGGGARASVAGG